MGVAEHLSELPDVRQPLEGVAGEHDWGQTGGTNYTQNWLRNNTTCVLSIYTASTSTMTALTELTEGEEEADLCELDLPLALGQQHPARALLLVLLLELG